MSAVLARARAELRARLPAVLALALLVGLASGAVMTTAAGARRTDSAYDRFARSHLAADVEVFPPFGPQFAQLDFGQVARLPQVAAAATLHFIGTTDDSLQLAAGDPAYGVTVDRPKMLAGRMPRPDSLDEAAVGFTVAQTRGLHVGSTLKVVLPGPDGSGVSLPVAFRIVGIEASPGEFPPQLSSFGISTQSNAVHVGDAFYRSIKGKYFSLDFLLLRLKRGAADVAALNDRLNAMAGGKAQLNASLDDQAANVRRSIHLQAVALWIVGALIALIGVLVLMQLLARQAVLDADENPTLLALGMTRTQVWLTGMSRAAVIGLAGGALGAVLGVAASPLMPIGTARIAEVHPGISLDPLVIGIGAAATLLAVLALAAVPLWKAASAIRPEGVASGVSSRPTLVARVAAAPIFPPPVATGMRLALEPGHGRTEVPVRSSLVSVILAIAALVSALTFAACLRHLLATPRDYGWNWDAYLSNESNGNPGPSAAAALQHVMDDPQIRDAALIDTPPVALGDRGNVRVNGMGLRPVKGAIGPVVVDGRAPAGADEIALGSKTLRDLHAHIGSLVPIRIDAIQGAVTVRLHVVGTVVIPPSSDSARLGVGAVFTIDGEKSMVPPSVHAPPITDLLITFAPGVDKDKALDGLSKALPDYSAVRQTRPSDLVNFGQVQDLPLALAALVALLAAATLAHTLVTAIRRRRRDLAILKILGFVPRQVSWAVAWQATTFICVALLVGLPLGIAAGRLVWAIFSGGIGVANKPVTPSMQLILAIPGAIVLANLIAAVPASIARRMRPATVLRAE